MQLKGDLCRKERLANLFLQTLLNSSALEDALDILFDGIDVRPFIEANITQYTEDLSEYRVNKLNYFSSSIVVNIST